MAVASRPTVRIHDLSDNSVTDREMNDEEYADYQTRQAIETTRQAEADAAAAAKETLLTKLGITEEEAALLA